MASRFRVEWTDNASADLADIIRYIAKESPLNATTVYRAIRRRAGALKTFPQRGHAVGELAELDIFSYRELSQAPYRIIYKIQDRTVFVHAVFDGRRDLKQILSERLLRLRPED